jgi:HPt (histidine-containing phosphotransfer) domain-containing protein
MAAGSGTTATVAEIDTAALDDLCESLGPQRARLLMRDFLKDTATRLARMQAQADRWDLNDWSDLIKEAHELSGNAGSFGLARLGNTAHFLHSAAASGNVAAVRGAMAHLAQCAAVDLGGLQALVDHPRPLEQQEG